MSILHNMSSNDLDVIANLSQLTMRQALHQAPLLKYDELLSHPTIQALTQLIEQQAQAAFDHPHVFFNVHLITEYVNKPYWSLDEAVSLCAGFDPFYFGLNPHWYAPKLRKHHIRLKAIVTKAIFARAFAVNFDDGRYLVEPNTFTTWALAAHIVDDFSLSFFTGIETDRPYASDDADTLRVPPPVNSQG